MALIKKIEGETLADMIEFQNGQLTLDYEKLSGYVAKIAKETNTYGKERKFNATDIGEIVVNPGVYGFKLNEKETAKAILEAFSKRKSKEIEPIYDKVGLNRYENGTDLKDTYIEVDLSRQHMWYYKDGELLIS